MLILLYFKRMKPNVVFKKCLDNKQFMIQKCIQSKSNYCPWLICSNIFANNNEEHNWICSI
jgi:hypothetical protein